MEDLILLIQTFFLNIYLYQISLWLEKVVNAIRRGAHIQFANHHIVKMQQKEIFQIMATIQEQFIMPTTEWK